jgi:hypothetical protein
LSLVYCCPSVRADRARDARSIPSGEVTDRRFRPRRPVADQNIENNPMQSSLAVAGISDHAKTF